MTLPVDSTAPADSTGDPRNGKKPLLSARDLVQEFVVREAAAPGAASCRPSPACRSTSCPARRSASSARPARASRRSPARCCRRRRPKSGSVVLPRHGAHQAARRTRCCRPRRHMQLVFQDPFGSLDPKWQVRSDRRGAARSPTRSATGPRGTQRVGRAARPGRPRPGQVRQAAPARAVRRPGAAGRDRARRRPRAVAAHLRRGGLLARRADPGAGAQPASSGCAASSACPTCSSRTTWRSSSRSATGSR